MTGGDPRTSRTGAVPGAGVFGMGLFLASLGVLFAAAIVGYLIVRLKAANWPPPGMPRLPAGLGAATVILIAASVSIQGALRAIRRDETAAAARRLGATLVLVSAFLGVQIWNWWALIRFKVTAASNLYAFTFFMLTGLHAAHVVGGIAWLAVVWTWARMGRYRSSYHPGIVYSAMYVHFLDAIWILLYGVMVIAA